MLEGVAYKWIMTGMLRWLAMGASLLLLVGCKSKTTQLSHELVAEHAHDSGCYTQGLEFREGFLLESAGQYGESKIRRVNPRTLEVLQERSLPAAIFAEGLTVLKGELWLLTWKEGKAYVFDAASFDLLRTHNYEGEGWGICTDGQKLFMSNGSNILRLRDPGDFSVLGEIRVTCNGKPQHHLNELEFHDGSIYANVYQKDEIVRIDAASGEVTGVIDLSALRGKFSWAKAEQLNGIARHPETGHLWVTGKYWPKMFEIKLSDP